jgi:hypothetical protein
MQAAGSARVRIPIFPKHRNSGPVLKTVLLVNL